MQSDMYGIMGLVRPNPCWCVEAVRRDRAFKQELSPWYCYMEDVITAVISFAFHTLSIT